VVLPPPAIQRDEPFLVDRLACRCAKYRELAVLNSHLFDFHARWMYVLGVGVAGGTALKMRVGRSESHVGKVRLAVIVGMRDKDKLTLRETLKPDTSL
jgi:hypothetical protein